MRIHNASLRALSAIVVLSGFVLAAFTVQATPMLTLSAELFDEDGERLASESGALAFGGPVNTLSIDANTGESGASASVIGTYDLSSIKNYVATLGPPSGGLEVVGDTRWIAKIGFDVHLQSFTPGQQFSRCQEAHLGPQAFTVERTNEKYAVWAIAPNSVTGFAPLLDEPGNTIAYNVQFFSDVAWPQDFASNLFAPFGNGPNLDFRGEWLDVITLMSQGHQLVVDLDVLGVAQGERYGFAEDLRVEAFLPFIGSPTSPTPREAFLQLDPVHGYAFAQTVPEPSTLALMVIGLMLPVWNKRYRR